MMSGKPAQHGRRQSKCSPAELCWALTKYPRQSIASSAELVEEPPRFMLGERSLLGHYGRDTLDGRRLAFPFARQHRINPPGPPFDDGKTGAGADQQKGAVRLDHIDRGNRVIAHG